MEDVGSDSERTVCPHSQRADAPGKPAGRPAGLAGCTQTGRGDGVAGGGPGPSAHQPGLCPADRRRPGLAGAGLGRGWRGAGVVSVPPGGILSGRI